MNKLRNKKSKLFSLIIIVGLLAGLLPSQGILTAKAATNQATIGALTAESGYGWTVSDANEGGVGTATYSSGVKLRLRAGISDYTYTAGDQLTINYSSSIDPSAVSVLVCNTNSVYENLGTLVSGQGQVTFTLPESTKITEETPANYIRLQGNTGASSEDTLAITSITLGTPDSSENPGGGEESKDPEEQPKQEDGPVLTVEESDGYTLTKNDDGSIIVSYEPGTWNTLNISVKGSDITKFSKLVVDVTPTAGMNLGILDQDGSYLRNHWGEGVFESNDRTKLEYELESDITGLVFYCDPPTGVALPEGTQTFVINSISIVDPSAPEPENTLTEKARFTSFSADSGCTIDNSSEGGIATISYSAGATVKLKSLFEDYTYQEGDLLVIDFEGIDDITTVSQIIIGYGTSTGQYKTLPKPQVDGNRAVFTLPACSDFTEKQPNFIRFKGVFSESLTQTVFNGFHIYDATEYAEYISGGKPVYDEAQCPQGLAVSYYSDIYSRGFAWSTNDQVTESNLEYIKATDDMTKENIDWSQATLVAAVMSEREDNEQTLWHLFKVHLENLEPGATYYFRAGHVDTGYGKTGSFKIAGNSDSIDKLTFVHLTDCQEASQSGYTKWSKVLEQAYITAPDSKFVAFTGDLTNDSHANLTMKQWVWGLQEPSGTLLDTVLEPSSGNHDSYDYSFTDRFDINWGDYDNGDITDQKSGGCYSFKYGDNIAFITLNSNESDGGDETYGAQKNWLIGELEKYKDCKWKIVQIHKGMMSTGDHTNDGDVDYLRDELSKIFAEYKVDLVLQGHDHVYTRSRSYYYGYDFDGQLYDGVTPIWLDSDIIFDYNFNGTTRMVNLEPSGTHYVTINFCASKTYPVETNLDEDIYIGVNPLEGNGCSVQPNLPMYGVVQIDGDTLIYDAYTYNPSSKTSALYDTFAVSKTNDKGYRDRNEGKEEIKISGIKVESKKYDGKPVKLDIKGFVSAEPSFMDYTTLSFLIEGRDGTSYSSTSELPKEVGKYTMTISLPTKNRHFYGSQVIDFEITK